jgi:catechol 2,3-dioxygenase-like lactoylglutathione lyase family enzyme
MTTDEKSLHGLHHVTAITADAQKNIDFYCGVLGLRLVKLTVNFDDPGSYHLYYGDELGRPGTILTFFAWAGAYRGRIGPPQVTLTAFAVPSGALDYWTKRLKEQGVKPQAPVDRFGETVLGFADPDGMQLEIVSSLKSVEPKCQPWAAGPIPVEQAIRGFQSITISEEGYEDTARLLTKVMGFKVVGNERNRFRYRAGTGDGFASTVDLLCVPDAHHGSMGAGVVHHVAFRTPDDVEQTAWRNEIVSKGFNVSPVMDRTYFHSIYYREPGGVLFEIATDNPGFTADEPAEQLGTKLRLPPWLEPDRAVIERVLPPVRLPVGRAKDRNH